MIGGESGPHARPFDLAWARLAIAQCRDAGVPVFVKQLGAAPCEGYDGEPSRRTGRQYARKWIDFRDRAGADPAEWPEDLRVREFPR